jgi:hypothetical protein
MALAHATKEAIWMRSILSELGFPIEIPLVINVDNEGAIALAKNPVQHARTKHIDIRYHFIRERIANKEISLVHCPTNVMTADVLTKSLPRDIFEFHRNNLGVLPLKI